jgi:murein DD-endopeptidase MepM/ murein hydrolase activator NlpD
MVSDYGMRRNPFHGHREFHEGLDFRAKTGTPIKVVGNGIVTEAGRPQSGYGLQVEVDHGHGYITKYAHCSKLMVNRGDTVQRGDVIALSGNTGYSTGPHLHYEVLKNGKKVNPRDYFYSD